MLKLDNFLSEISPPRNSVIYDAHVFCTFSRVIKTEFEKEVMRYAARISSNAHKAVMNMAKPGLFEYQCEAMFLHYVYHTGGCRHVAYTCICASGENGATLHYGSHVNPNRKLMADGDLWYIILLKISLKCYSASFNINWTRKVSCKIVLIPILC